MASLRDKLERLTARTPFRRDVGLLAGGTLISQIIAGLAAIALARLYDPSDFGTLLVYTCVVELLLVVASLRYELAIPLPEDEGDAASLLILSLALVFVTSGCAAVAVFLAPRLILSWSDDYALLHHLWLVPIGLWGAGICQALSYWAIRQRRFLTLSSTRVAQSAGRALVQIASAGATHGPLGLLAGCVVGHVLGGGRLAVAALGHGALQLKGRVSRWPKLARRYRRFPLLSSMSSLLNSAGLTVPMLMFAGIYGSTVAGWLALGQRVVGVPMVFLGQAVAQVFLSEGATLVRTDFGRFRMLFRKAARSLLLVGALPMMFLAIASPWLFALLFGEEWREAGRYVQLLAVGHLSQFVVAPLSQTLNLLERQDLQLGWDAVRLGLGAGTIWCSWALGWSAAGAIAAYAVSMTSAYLYLLWLCELSLRQRARKLRTDSPPFSELTLQRRTSETIDV